VRAAFLHVAAFGGNGGIADPVLQALHGLVVQSVRLAVDGHVVAAGGEACAGGEHQAKGGGARDEITAVQGVHAR